MPQYWRAAAAHMRDYHGGFRVTWRNALAHAANALWFARYGHPEVGERVGFGKWRAGRCEPELKVWLDDLRAPPDDNWTWVKNSKTAIKWLNNHPVSEVSLDHDLGGDDTAMPVARLIEERAHMGMLPRIAWRVHSANPVGRVNLDAALRSAERFWSQQE